LQCGNEKLASQSGKIFSFRQNEKIMSIWPSEKRKELVFQYILGKENNGGKC